MKKKKKLPLIITVCLVCIGIVLAIVLTGRAGREEPPDTAVVARGDVVVTAPVRGNVEMPNKAYLSFGITGMVIEVLVDNGDTVEKDQVLARVDASSLELGVEMAELQVEIGQMQVKAARAQYEIALINLKNPGTPPLGESEEVLKQRADMAKASWETAKLNLEMAKLNLESAKLNLEKSVIVAPFDGVVADIQISEGKEISAAALAAPSISLVDTSEIEMRGFIDELDIAAVKLGQAVNISLDARRDLEAKGKVAFVSPIGTVRLGVVSYETIITLDEFYQGLRDGMSATADIIIERRDDVLLIPNRAIRGTREKPMVIIDTDGQLEEREITLGLTDGINTEILSGLEEGEKVLVGTLPASSSEPRGPFGILR
jgi:RND family efflux transporter MFP subunit